MSETETPAAPAAPATPSSKPVIAPVSPLQKDTDRAARPGFRSPANKGSKAQKAGKKK